MASDSSAVNSMGFSVAADLKGTQKGEFRIDTATGMLLNSEISSEIDGDMTVAGAKVPVTIETRVKVDGHKK